MSLSKPNDFAADVLATLKRRKITFHGCPPWYLEHRPGGDIKIWFYGHRNGVPWAGGLTILKEEGIDNAYLRGDSKTFADVCEKIIDHGQARFK